MLSSNWICSYTSFTFIYKKVIDFRFSPTLKYVKLYVLFLFIIYLSPTFISTVLQKEMCNMTPLCYRREICLFSLSAFIDLWGLRKDFSTIYYRAYTSLSWLKDYFEKCYWCLITINPPDAIIYPDYWLLRLILGRGFQFQWSLYSEDTILQVKFIFFLLMSALSPHGRNRNWGLHSGR